MSKLSNPIVLAALCGSAFLTACPNDDTTGIGTETESSSSTGTVITTMPTTSSTTSDDTTTVADTTVGLDDTSSTGTTTTGESTTSESTTGESTTTGGSTTGGSSSESSSGEPPPPMDGYDDCANFTAALACLADEICIFEVLEGNAVCSEQACAIDADCTIPDTGNAVPTCIDINGDTTNDCLLACDGGETCPDGMFCLDGAFVCVWDLESVCPDDDLGSTVPQSVMGNNTGLGNEHDSTCGDGGGQDLTYEFTAPAAGTYVFDTEGSAIDTILSVVDGCGGMELDCNDDTTGVTSEVTIDLVAGQSVILVVDGYGGELGAITVHISQ